MIKTDVMTVREVAEYLKVKARTIYRLVANGEIPGFKVGGSWRFRKRRDRSMDRSKRGQAG